MRVPIPHKLGKDEARRRLKEKGGEAGKMFPGGACRSAYFDSRNST